MLQSYKDFAILVEADPMRPLGDDKFAAKVIRIRRHTPAPGEDIEVPVSLGEEYGPTAGVAESRMIARAKRWLDGDPEATE